MCGSCTKATYAEGWRIFRSPRDIKAKYCKRYKCRRIEDIRRRHPAACVHNEVWCGECERMLKLLRKCATWWGRGSLSLSCSLALLLSCSLALLLPCSLALLLSCSLALYRYATASRRSTAGASYSSNTSRQVSGRASTNRTATGHATRACAATTM